MKDADWLIIAEDPRWHSISSREGPTEYWRYIKCSKCKHIAKELYVEGDRNSIMPKYCPECGAKMDRCGNVYNINGKERIR